jgi:RNA polymerase sigma-70 factor, ECF subfamily
LIPAFLWNYQENPVIPSGPAIAFQNIVYHGALMQETIWNPSSLQDRTLISRIKEGDQIAFETLMRKYQTHLSALVHWHAGQTTDEEDLLQLLMCKVYYSLKSFDLNRPFYPWLRRIAVNLCCDEKRRLRRKALTFTELEHSSIEARHPVHEINFYSSESRQDMSDMLQRVIGMLPERHQEVITLHHMQQMPYEEIGAILKCTPRAVRVKAFRARAALRKLLKGAFSAQTNCSESSTIIQKLDACCRKNLIKSSRRYRVNSGIKESPQAC